MAGHDSISALVQQLHKGSSSDKQAAATRLRSFAQGSRPSQQEMATAGAIQPLVQMLGGSEHLEQSSAAGALTAILDLQPQAIAAFVSAGGLPAVLRCLASSDEVVLVHAAWLVATGGQAAGFMRGLTDLCVHKA